MDEAPKRIWLDWPDANRGDVVYAELPERDTQPGQTEYVRADLHDATQARVRELEAGNRGLLRLNEETESRAEKAAAGVERLRAALRNIDALDPESMVNGCSADALRGLVNRMGDIARTALEQNKPETRIPEQPVSVLEQPDDAGR